MIAASAASRGRFMTGPTALYQVQFRVRKFGTLVNRFITRIAFSPTAFYPKYCIQHMNDNILSFHMNPKYICIINKISHSKEILNQASQDFTLERFYVGKAKMRLRRNVFYRWTILDDETKFGLTYIRSEMHTFIWNDVFWYGSPFTSHLWHHCFVRHIIGFLLFFSFLICNML